MRESFTATLERNRIFKSSFATEPYEVGWASEVRCFVRTLDVSDAEAGFTFTTQISPDGLVWCEHETEPRVVQGKGLVSWPIHDCGNWLRLVGEPWSPTAWAKLIIYVALKG